MKTRFLKHAAILGFAVAGIVWIAALLVSPRVVPPPLAQSEPAKSLSAPSIAPPSALPPASPGPETEPMETNATSVPLGSAHSPGKTNAALARTTPADPPIEDEMARVALSFVGADPYAEEYWVAAINDPELSAHERSDLIEDLNEDGLSDPKHPSPDDLPMILNRLWLIEELAPYAMDQVNADAFQEAYKDLVNLAEVAVGRGEPVK